MPIIKLYTKDGIEQVTAEPGAKLSDLLEDHHHAPDMPCGGAGRCGKCRVRASGNLSEVTAEEKKCLSHEDFSQGIRLACCTKVMGDAEVWLAADGAVSQICASGTEQEFEQDAMFKNYGVAIDIGTTTLAAQLYDNSGLISTITAHNPQRSYGADVISRIGRSVEGEAHELAVCIREGLSDMMIKLCKQVNCTPEDVDYMVITGNTAMLYLLTEQDAKPLAGAPFIIDEKFGRSIKASQLQLPCNPDTPVYLPRCISAFVGADITTALMASGICTRRESAMLADIGTNGELALWRDGSLFTCSTAAGPAFEGANLSSGMQGAPGAIDHIWVEDGKLVMHTIGDKKPVGICGSGVADLLACLISTEELDESGFLEDEEVELAENVSFTQADVRQVQLAKSAVRAGMETLLKESGVGYDDIDTLSVAGGFGSYLSLDSAAAIGLIPPSLAPRCASIGNAALSGAAMLLRSKKLMEESTALADKADSVDLASNPYFIDKYMEHMMF